MTEIMLTLEAAVDNLDVEIKPFMKELFLSTPNLHQQLRASGSSGLPAGGGGEIKKSSTALSPMRQAPGAGGGGGLISPTGAGFHARSTSYSVSHYVRRNMGAALPTVSSAGVMDARSKFLSLFFSEHFFLFHSFNIRYIGTCAFSALQVAFLKDDGRHH